MTDNTKNIDLSSLDVLYTIKYISKVYSREACWRNYFDTTS